MMVDHWGVLSGSGAGKNLPIHAGFYLWVLATRRIYVLSC